MKVLRRFRRAAYRSASVAGDVEAIASASPAKIVRRLVRKKATSTTMGLLARLFR